MSLLVITGHCLSLHVITMSQLETQPADVCHHLSLICPVSAHGAPKHAIPVRTMSQLGTEVSTYVITSHYLSLLCHNSEPNLPTSAICHCYITTRARQF